MEGPLPSAHTGGVNDRSLDILLNATTSPYAEDPRGVLDVPILARVVWYRGEEEWVEAQAVESTHELIRVTLDDGRCAGRETWLYPEDTRHRE